MPKDLKNNNLMPSALIAIACLLFYITSCSFAFGRGCGAHCYFLYHFSHANVFHLALNLYALFRFRPRVKTCLIAYVSATVSAMLPFSSVGEPTCGLSGFIMAAYARKYHSWRISPWKLIAVNVALAFVPHMNWKIHVLSFLFAYMIYGALQGYGKYRDSKGDS